MNDPLLKLKPFDEERHLRVIVETPRGSAVKLKYEPKARLFTISRSLPLGVTYPYDWGFVPGTHAADGDPLDAMVLHEASTYPGILLACRVLGMVRVTQRGESERREHNDRIIAVPTWNDRLRDVRDYRALPARMREELEQLFVTVTLFTGKDVRIEGWRSRSAAERLVRAGKT